jgi:nitroreductase
MQIKNTIESIKERYSCRAFADKLPSDEHLQIITEAALSAPSAMNMQPWRVIFVKNNQLLDELEAEAIKSIAALEDKSTYERVMSRGGKVYYNAPCQIILPISAPETNK